MPYYIVESHEFEIEHDGERLRGTLADDYPVYLYKLAVDATRDQILQWPVSVHDRAGHGPRRSPMGTEAWWINARGSDALWPGTTRRCDAHALPDEDAPRRAVPNATPGAPAGPTGGS